MGQHPLEMLFANAVPFILNLFWSWVDRSEEQPKVTADTSQAAMTKRSQGDLSGLSNENIMEDFVALASASKNRRTGREAPASKTKSKRKSAASSATSTAKKQRKRAVNDDSMVKQSMMAKKEKFGKHF